MAKETKNYDGDLQMFREHSKPLNVAHLRFLRWLAERGQLEHVPMGAPAGAVAESSGWYLGSQQVAEDRGA